MGGSIEGLDSLLKKLSKLGGNVEETLYKSIDRQSKLVQGDAKDLCDVDTGDLRNSIKTETKIKGDKIVGSIFTNSDHGPYVEFGTGKKGEASGGDKYPGPISYKQDKWLVNIPDVGPRWIEGQPAQPFMYPALKNNEERILENIKKDIKKEIRELARR
ncbi:HK97-gp10 family putative phage morphogenesis protein [Clostridium sp. UBA1056]|uniref:HK97-gp10 family putative phage morphogenesis protein n=1 Tax=unclassified Clostridium TaxID=2614128 RepID=UPI0032167846